MRNYAPKFGFKFNYSSEKVKIKCFSACLIPKQNLKKDIFISFILSYNMFCEVFHKLINFQIIKNSGCALSPPLNKGPI